MINGNGMHFDSSISEGAIMAAHGAILDILNAKADQKTIRVALGCLGKSLKHGNCVVTNCVVNGSGGYGINKSESDQGLKETE